MEKHINYFFITTESLAFVTLLSGCILSSTLVSADDVVDNVSVTVPVSCTMSGSGMNSHSASIVNGTYQANIGSTTMTVFCNDNSGFSIYAIGQSGSTLGNNKLIGASTGQEIITGTATTSGDPDTSNWAMKLATDSEATYPITILSDNNEQSFASYHTIPNEYTKVATRLSGTDAGSNATGATLTSTYAAYISKTQAADTYSGKVKFVLVHPNDGAAPTIPTASTCNTPVPNLTYMQDLNSSNKASVLASMTEDQQYFLKDKRDEKSYCVAKLKDGNIWMTQNLDHDIVTTSNYYTNENTDIGWNGSSYTSTTWTAANATTSTASSWTSTLTAPLSYNPGDLYWNTTISDFNDWTAYENSCYNSGAMLICDESLNPIDTYVGDTGDSHYHLGNYYNWSAAVAMNDISSYTTEGVDLDRSICPANWTLPRIGRANGSFYNLWNQYGFASSSFNDVDNNSVYDEGEDALWTDPLYFVNSGGFYGSLSDVGLGGLFWSPVTNDGHGVGYAFFRTDGYVYPDGISRPVSLPVRCVARPVENYQEITYDVSVELSRAVQSISIYSEEYGTQTITNINYDYNYFSSGEYSEIIALHPNTEYTISATVGNIWGTVGFGYWITDSHGSLNNENDNPTTFTINGNSTLSIVCYEQEI